MLLSEGGSSVIDDTIKIIVEYAAAQNAGQDAYIIAIIGFVSSILVALIGAVFAYRTAIRMAKENKDQAVELAVTNTKQKIAMDNRNKRKELYSETRTILHEVLTRCQSLAMQLDEKMTNEYILNDAIRMQPRDEILKIRERLIDYADNTVPQLPIFCPPNLTNHIVTISEDLSGLSKRILTLIDSFYLPIQKPKEAKNEIESILDASTQIAVKLISLTDMIRKDLDID